MTVGIIATKNGLSSFEEIQEALQKKYPKLRTVDFSTHPEDASIIFSNSGIPEQEIYLENLGTNPGKLRLVMGVGGSFDYLTGKVRRAPKIFRRLGLEWLWRFLLEPRYRAHRIWNAVIVFPVKVLRKK